MIEKTWFHPGLLAALIFLVGLFANKISAEQTISKPAVPVLQLVPQLAQNDVSAEVYVLVQQLQQEVRELRGQIEELNYRVNQSSKQERERYLDLDRRILELREQLKVKPAPEVAELVPEQSLSQESEPAHTAEVNESARSQYNKAYDLIKQRRYDEAVVALHTFINDNPDSDLTPNAYYWLGEVYLVLPKLEQARQSFVVVIGKYPDHRKAADALYKLGVTYHRLGKNDEARKYLNQTLDRYPDSAAANLAKDYLKKM